jgi:glycine oxidase
LLVFYNASVKTWDVIIIGGGIIGLSLAISLRKRGAQVLVIERGEPGHEASHAAAGMLVDHPDDTPVALQPLATASARMYPEFVHELQDESGVHCDLREQGTIVFPSPEHTNREEILDPVNLAQLEPGLAGANRPAHFLKERSVDPRALVAAALKASKHRAVDLSSGSAVTSVLLSDGRVCGVATGRANYSAATVVNCAGAWAGHLPPHHFPTRPVKGQMLAVVGQHLLTHVVRSPEVYLVPRSDGRVLIGATVEEAGYDKRTDANTVQRLHHSAICLVPSLQEARVSEAWAGLRPGTPDGLPILGESDTPRYFVATGHFRDGILLAPVTAEVMARTILGEKPRPDISAFSPARFGQLAAVS